MASPFNIGGLKKQFTGAGFGSLGHQVPQMSEGLGLPGGQALFNLPSSFTPGQTSDINLEGFPQGTQANINVRRTASSDPIKNILGDLANPLSGTAVNFSPGVPGQSLDQGPLEQGGLPDFSGMFDRPGGLGNSGFLRHIGNEGGGLPKFLRPLGGQPGGLGQFGDLRTQLVNQLIRSSGGPLPFVVA